MDDNLTLPVDSLKRIEFVEATAAKTLRQLSLLNTPANPDFLRTPLNIQEGGRRVTEYVLDYGRRVFDAHAIEYAHRVGSLDQRQSTLEEIVAYVGQKTQLFWLQWLIHANKRSDLTWQLQTIRDAGDVRRLENDILDQPEPELNGAISALLTRFDERMKQMLNERLIYWTSAMNVGAAVESKDTSTRIGYRADVRA